MAVNLKSIVQSNGFKIYFWPILICYLINALCLYLFLPIEPDSRTENIFVLLVNLVLLGCLWVLVVRYRNIMGKSVGKRTIVLLVIFTAIDLVGCIMIFLGLVLAFWLL
jgi:hypothetical protein